VSFCLGKKQVVTEPVECALRSNLFKLGKGPPFSLVRERSQAILQSFSLELKELKGDKMKFCILVFLILPLLLNSEIGTKKAYDFLDCQFANVKSKEKPSCLIEEQDGEDFNLYVYDVQDSKISGPTHKISVPSRYNLAKIRFEDILGEGIKMIFVQVEGVVGKDTNQELLFVFHFQEEDFKPVLFETVSYDSGCCNEKLKLKNQFRFQDYGTKRVSIFLDYSYTTYSNGKPKLKERKHWTNELIWDYKTHTFYDLELETKKLKKAEFFLEKNIHAIRLDFPLIQGKNQDEFKKQIRLSKIYSHLMDKKSAL
jgi:hypothetical protein